MVGTHPALIVDRPCSILIWTTCQPPLVPDVLSCPGMCFSNQLCPIPAIYKECLVSALVLVGWFSVLIYSTGQLLLDHHSLLTFSCLLLTPVLCTGMNLIRCECVITNCTYDKKKPPTGSIPMALLSSPVEYKLHCLQFFQLGPKILWLTSCRKRAGIVSLQPFVAVSVAVVVDSPTIMKQLTLPHSSHRY